MSESTPRYCDLGWFFVPTNTAMAYAFIGFSAVNVLYMAALLAGIVIAGSPDPLKAYVPHFFTASLGTFYGVGSWRWARVRCQCGKGEEILRCHQCRVRMCRSCQPRTTAIVYYGRMDGALARHITKKSLYCDNCSVNVRSVDEWQPVM